MDTAMAHGSAKSWCNARVKDWQSRDWRTPNAKTKPLVLAGMRSQRSQCAGPADAQVFFLSFTSGCSSLASDGKQLQASVFGAQAIMAHELLLWRRE